MRIVCQGRLLGAVLAVGFCALGCGAKGGAAADAPPKPAGLVKSFQSEPEDSGGGGVFEEPVGPSGSIRGATAMTAGDGLSPEQIQKVVHGGIGGVKACYEQAIKSDPTIGGMVEVKFTVDSQGVVTQASSGNANIAKPDLITCVVDAVQKLRFPAPEKSASTIVTYPFHFSPGALR